jgi:hypothetical protein
MEVKMAIQISPHEMTYLLETSESILVLNKTIDEFKIQPQDSTSIRYQFIYLKNIWDTYKSFATLGQGGHYQLIDYGMQRLQKRVEKLLKKYPPAILGTSLGNRCIQCHEEFMDGDDVVDRIDKYCSQKCADLAQNQSAQLLKDKCIYCRSKPKFVDTMGKVRDYCEKSCSRLNGSSRKKDSRLEI